MLALAFEVQPVGAVGTVYIRADGSVDPPSAPISSLDNVTYTFTGNVNDSIVVERDNIVVDGAGYAVQGTGSGNGIDLSGRSNVTIKNVNVVAFNYGIYLNGGSGNTLTGNNITANANYGIYLYGSTHNSITQNTIANNEWHGVWLFSSSNGNIISHNNVTSNSHGIAVTSSSNCIVSCNNITINGDGIWLSGANCIIYNNSITNNDNGIGGASSNCIVSCNNITNNGYGIDLSNSNNNNISYNNITANNYGGIDLSYSSNGNTISHNNIIANDYWGIWLSYSSNNNNISYNNITNNYDGIDLSYSSNGNTISHNNITSNRYGIDLDFSSANNVIYHNNFVNNTFSASTFYPGENVWHDGYPSGGNYWSDYTGADLFSGPYQNETGSDGIGDKLYIIDGYNWDRYPLMKPYPWSQHDIGITNIAPLKTVIGQGFTVHFSVSTFNYGNNTENFNVTLLANTTSIASQTITLASRNSTTITFTWNTTGFAKGKYTIKAYAWPVQGEADTADNTFSDGTVYVSIPGDVNADTVVDIFDLITVANSYGSGPDDPKWNPNADINGDNTIDIFDLVTIAKHYGQTDP